MPNTKARWDKASVYRSTKLFLIFFIFCLSLVLLLFLFFFFFWEFHCVTRVALNSNPPILASQVWVYNHAPQHRTLCLFWNVIGLHRWVLTSFLICGDVSPPQSPYFETKMAPLHMAVLLHFINDVPYVPLKQIVKINKIQIFPFSFYRGITVTDKIFPQRMVMHNQNWLNYVYT